MAELPPADLPALPGRDKPIERCGLGSYVLTYDGGDGRWGRVSAIYSGVHPESGRRVTELRVVDDAAQEGWGVRDWNNTPMRCCTKAEAKRAGLIPAERLEDTDAR